jgi:putative phosphoribosyl transferase
MAAMQSWDSLRIAVEAVELRSDLVVPEGARGIVLFAHGSGSGRLSPRNRFVAQALQQAGLATLLFDLLTRTEESSDMRTRELRFNIPLLAGRLVGAVDWVRANEDVADLAVGLFGASTGAAAALIAAAERPDVVKAVVSRGGRPDLAGAALPRVKAPSLFIVGSRDHEVIGLNKGAMDRMSGVRKLAIVQGATHLFEESGALEEVALLAGQWFTAHLGNEQPGTQA